MSVRGANGLPAQNIPLRQGYDLKPMPKFATAPVTLGKLFEHSARLFFASFMAVLLPNSVLTAWSFLPGLLIPELSSPDPKVLMEGMNIFLSYFPFYLTGILILYATLFYRINVLLGEQTLNNFQAFMLAMRKLLPLFVAAILYTLFNVLGMMIIFPAIYFGIALILFMPCILFDRANGFTALTASYNLVAGEWWRTSAAITFPVLVSLFLGLLSIGSLESLLVIFGENKIEVVPYLQFTYTLVTGLLSPLYVTTLLLHYHDLKLRKQQSPFAPPQAFVA